MEYDLIVKVANFFKTLSDPTRVKIINILINGEQCVGCIAKEANMSSSAVSHQLRFLRNTNIIKSRREGKNIFYSLADSHIQDIIKISIEHQLH